MRVALAGAHNQREGAATLTAAQQRMIYHGGPSWNTEGITGGHHGGGGRGDSGDFGPCREDLFDPLFVNEQGMLSRHPCVHRYRRIVNKTMADAHAPDHWCSTSIKGAPKAAPPPQPWWQRQQQQQQQQHQQQQQQQQ